MTTRTPDRCISTLAEDTRAVLVSCTFECTGFWRWEAVKPRKGEPPRQRRAFYEVLRNGVTLRLSMRSERDVPTRWRPLDCDDRRPAAALPPAPARTPPAGFAPSIPAADEPVEPPHVVMERRVVTALRVDRALPDRELSRLRVRVLWPETCPGPGDYPPEQVTRFKPTRADLDDYLPTMALIATLSRRAIRVLRLKAHGFTFRTIGERVGCGEDEARAIHRRALADLVQAVAAGRASRRRTRTTGREGAGHGREA